MLRTGDVIKLGRVPIIIKESSVDKNKLIHKGAQPKNEKYKTILNFPIARGPGNVVKSSLRDPFNDLALNLLDHKGHNTQTSNDLSHFQNLSKFLSNDSNDFANAL